MIDVGVAVCGVLSGGVGEVVGDKVKGSSASIFRPDT